MQLSRLFPAAKFSSQPRPATSRCRRQKHKARKPTGLHFEPLEARALLAVFTVANTGDNAGVNPAPFAGTGTLRQAMVDANANLGADTINFNIPTTDPGYNGQWWTIRLGSAAPGMDAALGTQLPTLTNSGTTINGFSQTTNQGDTNPGTVGSGIIPGVADSGNQGQPLTFQKPEIAIEANNASIAFEIGGNASNITIRGMSVYDTGVVTGDSVRGVVGRGGSGTNREVEFMFIGVLPNGMDPGVTERNQGFGVQQETGGVLEIDWNYIGFNGRGGIDGQANTSVVFVEQNEVFENGWASAAHDGIDLNGINGEARYNLSRNNRNLTNVPNGGAGNGIELGSQTAGTGFNLVEYNTIFGNVSAGISDRAGASGNTIQKNVIYDNEVGISVNIENPLTRTPTNRNKFSQNSIYQNMGLGIDLQHATTGVSWLGNATVPVGTLAGPDGVTPNDNHPVCDADQGSNDLQNYPELMSAISGSGQTRIEGTLDSTASTTFRIEFFRTPITDMFGVGDREGRYFIGSILVTTDADCHATFSAQFSSDVPEDEVITATATKFTTETEPWSTSEFSGPITVNQVDLSGKVTGGGWYNQPVGSFPAPDTDPTTDERANFGFVAMYKQDDPVPTGNTNFKYHPTKLHFHSTSYAPLSLIVTGGEEEPQNARWRGLGKLNNQPGYGFEVNLTDNGEPGSSDTFRIHIWKEVDNDPFTEDEGGIVYENGSDVTETIIDGGNLQVHIKANALQLAGVVEGTPAGGVQVLTEEVLNSAVAEAIVWWSGEGVDDADLAVLADAQVLVTTLPDSFLGVAAKGVIGIDVDAAGLGWSLGAAALGGVDLLSVVTHELGHLLGFEHDDHEDSVMAATLEPGTRLVAEHVHLPAVVFATSSLFTTGAISVAANLPLQSEAANLPMMLDAIGDTRAAFATTADVPRVDRRDQYIWDDDILTAAMRQPFGIDVVARAMADHAIRVAHPSPANAHLSSRSWTEIALTDEEQAREKRAAIAPSVEEEKDQANALAPIDESELQLADQALAAEATDILSAPGAALSEESGAETLSTASEWWQACDAYFGGESDGVDLREVTALAAAIAIVATGRQAMRRGQTSGAETPSKRQQPFRVRSRKSLL